MTKLFFVAVVTLVLLAAILAWANWPYSPLSADAVADRVVVIKSSRKLELFNGSELLRSYDISLGRHPQGAKIQEGDGRTPEGAYRLDYKKADSSFHRAIHISYPTPSDVASATSRGMQPGGLIMIHGMKNHLGWIGRAHRFFNWTDGCVAVTDSEIEEISRAVRDGTPILIKP